MISSDIQPDAFLSFLALTFPPSHSREAGEPKNQHPSFTGWGTDLLKILSLAFAES